MCIFICVHERECLFVTEYVCAVMLISLIIHSSIFFFYTPDASNSRWQGKNYLDFKGVRMLL